jgi:transcriptional regulator with XRE-family HTH domain
MSNENEGVDESGWDLEPGDESAPLIEAVGRLVRFCREQAGMRVADFAQVMGYGEDMIRKIERGARIPRVEFLDRADDVLNAHGHLRAFMEDVERAEYPKRVPRSTHGRCTRCGSRPLLRKWWNGRQPHGWPASRSSSGSLPRRSVLSRNR